MTTTLNATTSNGLVVTPDNSGTIQLQSNGTTKATISSSGFYAPGSIVQVVYGSTTTPTTGVGTTYTSMGLSATITPTSASSKILIQAVAYSGDSGSHAVWFQLYKNGSAISGTTATQYHGAGSNPDYACAPTNLNYLDSPATTSSVTYAVFGRADGGTVTIGGPRLNGYGQGTALQLNSIILMEVAQ